MQGYDLLEQEVEQSFSVRSLWNTIDQWERESIGKIQITAKTARVHLLQIIDISKERFSRIYRDTINHLHSSQAANDASTSKLHQWMEQLKQLHYELITSSTSQLLDHQPSVNIQNIGKDRFSKVIGSVVLNDSALLAKHTNDDWNFEYVLGERLYSQGRHQIRLKIEQNGTPYNIFFGCISSHAISTRISIKSSFTVGWFGSNQVYQHGVRNDNSDLTGYSSSEFAANDILHLTFDCDNKQIELFHEDTNKNHVLRVDTTKASLPWQLLMILTDRDDCVRILPSETFHLTKRIETDFSTE